MLSKKHTLGLDNHKKSIYWDSLVFIAKELDYGSSSPNKKPSSNSSVAIAACGFRKACAIERS